MWKRVTAWLWLSAGKTDCSFFINDVQKHHFWAKSMTFLAYGKFHLQKITENSNGIFLYIGDSIDSIFSFSNHSIQAVPKTYVNDLISYHFNRHHFDLIEFMFNYLFFIWGIFYSFFLFNVFIKNWVSISQRKQQFIVESFQYWERTHKLKQKKSIHDGREYREIPIGRRI